MLCLQTSTNRQKFVFKLHLQIYCRLILFRNEINVIRKKSVILSAIAALLHTSTPMAALVSVITLVLTGQPITPVNVFMLLGFIDIIRLETCWHVASALLETYDAYASLGRIEDFLLLENLPVVSRAQCKEDTSNTEDAEGNSTEVMSGLLDHQGKLATLCVSNLTYKQTEQEHEFILQDIKLTTSFQSLTIITGPVGSGKSTLLSAIAGEISGISGTITCQGTLIYVPQIAWVFSGTIRENILFGQAYDEQKYTRIIEACALTEDIQQFPDSDRTVVGERGEVLSGGQQARVTLARAVYANADLYLLDDPLSAVDFKVGQHIFEKCIKDLLGNKTRVLVSHQEQHMKEADEVIVLCKGRVLEKGTFTELQGKGILNATFDPMYQAAWNDRKLDKSILTETEQKNDVRDSCERVMLPPSETKGMEISQEDRAIGVVSSKLYWEYFTSGQHWSVIFAVICFCFITQGKTHFVIVRSWCVRVIPKNPDFSNGPITRTQVVCLPQSDCKFNRDLLNFPFYRTSFHLPWKITKSGFYCTLNGAGKYNSVWDPFVR